MRKMAWTKSWKSSKIDGMANDPKPKWSTQHSIADWDSFRIMIFAVDLKDLKSTSEGVQCIFGSRMFIPISWVCKKQTSVHSVLLNLRIFLRMHVHAWMVFPLLISGIMESSSLFVQCQHFSSASCAEAMSKRM